MMMHKFHVGDAVAFVPQSIFLNKALDDYRVVRLMPSGDQSDDPQYRLTSGSETHERVARESQLRRVSMQNAG